jgi:hypothetical protein
MSWLAVWIVGLPIILDQPQLLALWLAVGWWFLPDDWWL